MKFAFAIGLFLIYAIFSAAAAQKPNSTPTPQPAPAPSPGQTPDTWRDTASMPTNSRKPGSGDTARSSQFMRGYSDSGNNQTSYRVIYLQRYVAPLYRKPTDDELATIEPSAEIKERYAEFLRQSDTGIARLIPDNGCATNDRVVSAREECLKYSMPGAGSSYSFRAGSYRLPQLSDITFDAKKFSMGGRFLNGTLADIGSVPIQNVTLTTPGVGYASCITAFSELSDAISADREMRKGVEKDGFQYSKSVPAADGRTYILRSIAYRGRAIRAVQGIAYNELDFDKRKDVLVVFKVAAVDADGSVTIVWKRLAESDSPRLKTPKKTDGDEAGDTEKL